MKQKWYLQTWFICILFIFWPAGIPAAIAVVLLILQHLENKKVLSEFENLESLKTRGEVLKTQNANFEASAESSRKDFEQEKKQLQEEIHSLENLILSKHYNFSDYDSITSEECIA